MTFVDSSAHELIGIVLGFLLGIPELGVGFRVRVQG